MTDAAVPPVTLYRLDPLRAAKALRRLMADKEDTEQVFEIMRALNGRAVPRGYLRLRRTAAGEALALARPELAPHLDARVWMEGLAPGTVGAAYAAFVDAQGFTAEGLAQESRKGAVLKIAVDHPFAWYGRRLRDVHDIWHVLTGYGRDALGEACVVAFSHAQGAGLGFGVIGLAGALRLQSVNPGLPIRKAVREAWRRGRRAAWLIGEDYEALLAEPLDAARSRLRLTPPATYLSIPADARDGLTLAA